jgi:hypothetical protein
MLFYHCARCRRHSMATRPRHCRCVATAPHRLNRGKRTMQQQTGKRYAAFSHCNGWLLTSRRARCWRASRHIQRRGVQKTPPKMSLVTEGKAVTLLWQTLDKQQSVTGDRRIGSLKWKKGEKRRESERITWKTNKHSGEIYHHSWTTIKLLTNHALRHHNGQTVLSSSW